jgi:hypothetical protein
MTTKQIDDIKRLLAEATPGPWNVHTQADGDYLLHTHTPYTYGVATVYAPSEADEAAEGEANAALIVAAVNSLPDLLAERDRLREALRLIIVTPLAIDDARDIARGALAESDGK